MGIMPVTLDAVVTNRQTVVLVARRMQVPVVAKALQLARFDELSV